MAKNEVSSGWKPNYNLDKMDEALAELKDHIAQVERAANAHTGVIMPVENASFDLKIHSNIGYYNSRKLDGNGNLDTFGWHTYKDERPLKDYKKTAEVARKHVAYWLEEARKIHEANVDAIANNIELARNIKRIMENIGIPEHYTEYRYKTNRSRKKTKFVEGAGWAADVSRYIKRTDGFAGFKKECERQLTRIAEWEKKQQKELDNQERQRLQEEKQQEDVMKRAVIIARYNVPNDQQDDDSLFEFLLNRNKYLKLAHKLLCIRHGVSYGYKYAKYAIDEFKADEKHDFDIVDDINECVENWDGDGRIFHSTKWNYDAIFSLVDDEQLHADYVTMREITLDMD